MELIGTLRKSRLWEIKVYLNLKPACLAAVVETRSEDCYQLPHYLNPTLTYQTLLFVDSY